MRDFPNVGGEPTSYVTSLARKGDVSSYTVMSCPSCGEEAYQHNTGTMKTWACRACEHGAGLLWKKANYGKAWGEVRQWVLDRDDHSCRECGAGQGEMHVHHKDKLIWFETAREAHRPDNLVTLCAECHDG